MFKRTSLIFVVLVGLVGGLMMAEELFAQEPLSFIARRELEVGLYPSSVALGDFNGDTIQDLAVSNMISSSVSILLGRGDGTFQPAQNFRVRGNPHNLVAGDFDGDEILDLALANGALLLGNGDGTFRNGPDFAMVGDFIAVGDFNNDDILDLAIANFNPNNVSILLGRGDGTFQSPRLYRVGSLPISIAVGDFNGDGIQDLVASNQGSLPEETGSVSILLGNGDGTFGAARAIMMGTPFSVVAVGDFNGDEHQDLAVATSFPSTVFILLGKGNGTFRTPLEIRIGQGIRALAIGDFNGDSVQDLVIAQGISGVSIWLGKGDGTFRPGQEFEVGIDSMSIAVEDFNSDKIQDLAVANSGRSRNDLGNIVSILTGNGDGTFRAAPTFAVGRGPQSVAAGDFNGDQIPDLAVANGGSDMAPGNTVSILLGNGDGTFQSPQTIRVGVNPSAIAVGDFNADSVADLAVTNFSSNTLSVLMGNGDGTFAAAQSIRVGRGPRSVVVADLNGDSLQDLVVANFSSNDLSVLLGNGDGTFAPVQTVEIGSHHWSVAVGDFNGDGLEDLAVTNEDTNNVTVLIGSGDGAFRSAQNFPVGLGPRSITVGDFNGDSIQDLAVANWGVGFDPGATVSILIGNGDGTFARAQDLRVVGPSAIVVGDFDGDQISDLAVTNRSFMIDRKFAVGASVSILLGQGDGTFHAAQSFGVQLNPSAMAIADFNGDGLPDLAVANAGSDNVSVLINNTPMLQKY